MSNLRTIGGIILACGIAVATANAAPLTVPAGATVTVRMLDTIDTGINYAGETSAQRSTIRCWWTARRSSRKARKRLGAWCPSRAPGVSKAVRC